MHFASGHVDVSRPETHKEVGPQSLTRGLHVDAEVVRHYVWHTELKMHDVFGMVQSAIDESPVDYWGIAIPVNVDELDDFIASIERSKSIADFDAVTTTFDADVGCFVYQCRWRAKMFSKK